MFRKILILFCLLSSSVLANGYDVFAIGMYDVKFDGSNTNPATDFRYERRFDNSIIEIGPESENFFNLKPFAGIELTSDSAAYFIGGIYLDDNLGTIFVGEESNYIFTPSFGIGYYDEGDGKKLGNNIEFRSTLEVSYELKNKNRLGLSFGHISNANLGDKNPGVEIISFSYQVPF
ncbi:acyloxyacyl hydrolase [Alphaproteobacteria bacterium]|nr:acyloxyacyl hydrolase [Alphaproteobacteria bacterium]